jgi:type I restriction-modification system DNA methylase subunit
MIRVLKNSHEVKYSPLNPIKQNQFVPSRFVISTLFNEAFVLRDIDKELGSYWLNEETSGFMEFWTHFCIFAKEFNKSGDEKFNWNYEETVTNLILPILEILGHGEINNTGLDHFLRNEEFSIPTISGNTVNIKIPLLVINSASKKNELIRNRKNPDVLLELRKNSAIPITVDYFTSLADNKIGKYDSMKTIKSSLSDDFTYLGNDLQCTEYLNLLEKDFGISTDGARWKIIHKSKTKEDSSLLYEFDLLQFLELVDGIDLENDTQGESALNCIKWFYWFFSKEGIYGSRLSFLSEVESRAKKYADHIEEDMKMRFVYAVTISVNGYLSTFQQKSKDQVNLDLIVSTSESLIFNLFFLRSCESKGIIPFHQNYKKDSLANLISKIEHYKPSLSWKENLSSLKSLEHIFGKTLGTDGFEIYDHIHKLFDVIKNGNSGFQIQGFLETVFEKMEYEFYTKYKLANDVMVGLLYELMYFQDNNTLKEIPYNTFSPRQLGSIYESFLEYKPTQAKTELYYIKEVTTKSNARKISCSWKSKRDLPKNSEVDSHYRVSKGDYIFSPNDEDKKDSGAYYTPHYLVEYVVRNTIGPITSKMRTKDELLSFKVCDPAMGSAHFLVEALSFLHKEFMRICPENKLRADIKKQILQSCIYGLDINPRAVKLAKMSLWLCTATVGQKLERLDKQFLVGNSLDIKMLEKKYKHKLGYDAIVGNPPWVFCKHVNLESAVENTANLLSTQGKVNLYSVFTEVSFQYLNKGGRLGFVLPNTFLRISTNSELRYKILKEHTITEVTDFGEGVFKGVTASTIGLFILKEKQSKVDFKVTNFGTREETYLKVATVLENTNYIIQTSLNSDDLDTINLVESASNARMLDYFKFSNGIATKADKNKYISNRKENRFYKPMLEGKDISSYRYCCIGPRKNESLGHLKVRGQINIENTDRLIWSTSSIT